MDSNKELLAVHNIISTLPRSIKMMRLYKRNNPIYSKTVEECYGRFMEYFQYNDTFDIQFRQNDIFYNSESVYSSTDQHDNFAFLFFKDGVKEISIGKDISVQEMEDFLRIISIDDREESENDIALLLWENDSRNIKYVVDQTFLDDYEDYEKEAMAELQQKPTAAKGVQEAFEELSHKEQKMLEDPVISLTEEDLQLLVNEIGTDANDKTGKLLTMLFEVLSETKGKEDCREIALFIMGAIKYSAAHANVRDVIIAQTMVKQCIENKNVHNEIKNQAGNIRTYISSKNIISLVGKIYDQKQNADMAVFDDFVTLLDKKAILPMISTLGEMETIQGRKIFIEALSKLGRKDISAVITGLNDSKWYVVRDVLYVLRKIADRETVDHVLKSVTHKEIKVKIEAIKTLGVIGGDNALDTLTDCLAYPDVQVRSASVRAIGNIGTEKAKNIIMNDMTGKNFKNREYSEKKLYFAVLSKWNDEDMFNFMIRTLKKKTFWSRADQNEKRACAAYALGLMGNMSAVSTLTAFQNERNERLRACCRSALWRLENGK
jgi:hypothetical protein